MAKYEARVKTIFGEIVLNFDSLEELRSNIEALDLNTASEIVQKRFETIAQIQKRNPKHGLEHLYDFTLSGLAELSYVPDTLTKPELIAFVLFAYHPEPASTEQIFLSSGIKNAASDYLTHPSYKKFWWKTQNGEYVLSDDGLKWISSKILPKLTAITQKEKLPKPANEETAGVTG